MKHILLCISLGTIFLSSTLYANDATQPHCSSNTIEKIESSLLESHRGGKFSVMLDDIFNSLDNCRAALYPAANSDMQDIVNFYHVINNVLTAQYNANKINDCLALGAATTEPWDSPFIKIENTAIYTDVKTTINRCHKKREQSLTHKFSALPCKLFGKNHKYSSAISIPKLWNISSQTACVYLDGGRSRSKPEEEGIALVENNPHLILFTQNGPEITEKYLPLNQGVFSSKNICLAGRIDHADFLAVSGDKNNPLIRVRSFAEHCIRNSVALKLDAIYRLSLEDELIPINELTITLKQ